MNDVEWHEYSGNGTNVSVNITVSTPFTTHHMTMYISLVQLTGGLNSTIELMELFVVSLNGAIIQVIISTHNKYDDHTQMMSNVHECRVRCGG